MTRAAHLALVLVLFVLSLAPVTAPVAAQQTLPTTFVDRWEGSVVERPSNQSGLEIVEVTGGNLGDVVGTHQGNFTSGLTCGGPMRLQRLAADGRWAEFAAEITTGVGTCLADGIITLTVQSDGSLSFNWRHPTNPATVTGTLTRTGGTTGGTTGGSTGDAWCADLAAIYGPAPAASGPWYGPLEQNQGYITRRRGAEGS